MSTPMRPPLLICRHGAWTAEAAACLEMTLTAGVFELKPVLVLLDAAVTLLLPDQQGEAVGLKTLARQLPALELYDVSSVHADVAALAAHGLDAEAPGEGIKPLSSGGLAGLIAAAGTVVVF